MTPSTQAHWLKTVAEHAGLDLSLPGRPSITDVRKAWPVVAAACRLADDKFTQRAAHHFRIGVADLGQYDPQAVKLLPEAIARRYGILPLNATEKTVVIATSDPANRAAHADIEAHTGRLPVFMMASPGQLERALERAYSPARSQKNTLQTLVARVAESDFQITTNQGQGLFTTFELEDPAVVKLCDVVLQQGLRYRATEIHVEPGAVHGRVRYRIDGVLQHVVDLPVAAHTRLVARLKHLALGQPGESPDDGFVVRISAEVERRAHLLTTSTADGELVLIRLVDPNVIPTLDNLDFDGRDFDKIRQLLGRKEGLILVTGPARSGTERFIYAALHSLRHQSVISLEGRPEIVVPGVTQVRYDPSAGRSFAEALSQLLDRSPDVIHAGEVRDLATARIVLRTALTGRKVLATVHTSDAVSGIRRLVDMGLAGGRLAESLHAVISLRLVRKLCTKCGRAFDPQKDVNSREAKLASVLRISPVRCAVGCRSCAGTGYVDQIPVAEILVVTPAMRAVLQGSPSDEEVLRAARADGMLTFTEGGLARVAKGETTVEEVERVLGVVPARVETAGSVGPVLVVEDEDGDRLLVSSALREAGFRVVEADDGFAAKELLESGDEAFCLVLLDLLMPGMHGAELLRMIRRSLSTQSLPVIVLTASDDPQHELELLEAGADDFLVKPIVVGRLKARVRAVLRRSGVSIAPGPGPAVDPVASPVPRPTATPPP